MRRLGLLGAVLLVLAAVYVAAWRTEPGPARTSAQSAARSVAVTAITRSCPPPGPDTGTAHIATISVPSQAQAAKASPASTGSVTLTAVPATPTVTKRQPAAKSTPTATSTPTAAATTSHSARQAHAAAAAQSVTMSAPGTQATVAAPAADLFGGTAVTATGQMAEGFAAEQATASGMGTVSCAYPSSDMWFVGTGAAAGAPDIRLYLTNTGDMAASVDVTILTDAGLQNVLNNGITVAPHQFVVEKIAPLVTGSVALALHVQTSSGQVAAAVWEGGGSGGSWLPQAAAPSTQLVIPGLTVASSAARLFVTVPGATDAQVKVLAFTVQGKFPQFGSTPVDAPAGATVSFPLTSLGASAAGLELTSNVPITAAVLVPGEGIGSFTTAVAPVTEQGVVAGNPATAGLTVGLLLTAPAAAVRANIAVIPSVGAGSAGAVGTQQLATVQAGHTAAVTVSGPKGSRQPFAIVITPLAGSGPLYAARVVTAGTGGLSATVVSLLPVPSALTVITLPPAEDSYSAILP
ncbi:DUF5719 family protein [Trebonia sp.]|uniref:DUF5719 family protein n=1 Tax=Trebonia sp. TaxID=2767075 RepID=UPI0026100D83|nr:DUF5719 family protein [Trebonia sp.]